MTTWLYVSTPGGKIHLQRRGQPWPYGLTECGRDAHNMDKGDETISGIAATCQRCRSRVPAGRSPEAGPDGHERRARYRADVLRWIADLLAVPGLGGETLSPPEPEAYGLTEAQAQSAREALAQVLRHRAEKGGRILL